MLSRSVFRAFANTLKTAGVEWLKRPRVGDWPYSGLPRAVEIRGRPFSRSLGLSRHDAVAHYREDVAEHSGHLYVRPDGTYIIDHRDDYNPHHALLTHLVKDVMSKEPGVAA
jgi:hypothetical protein